MKSGKLGVVVSTLWCAGLGGATHAWAQVTVGEPFLLEQEAVYGPADGEEYSGGLAEGPGEYFAVWLDQAGGLDFANGIYGQRIRLDGSFPAPGSLEIFEDPDGDPHGVPAVAWNGSVYLVIWNELGTHHLYGARVDQLGNVLDPGGFLIESTPSLDHHPAVASDGEDFLIVQSAQGGSLIGTRVGGDGAVLDADPIIISSGATGLGFPKLTYAAGVYMVVWAQTPDQAIRGARVTSEGVVLDPGGFNISGGGVDVDAFIDFDGENLYVTWNRNEGGNDLIMAAHVTTGGVIASGPTLLLDGGAAGFSFVAWPRVAWNGTHHLITLITNEPLFSTSDLYALEVDVLGNVVGAPFNVSTIEGEGADAYGIAAVDSQWFILWEGAEVIGSAFHYDTEGARVDTEGTVLDQPHLEVATGAAWQLTSGAAFDGTNFLCVFDDQREPPFAFYTDLYAARVTAVGEPIESTGFAIDTTPGSNQRDPQVIFDDGQYAVVYVHDQQPVTGVRLARVLPDGTVLDPGGITVYSHGSNSDTQEPGIASNGTDYCIVWYDGVVPPGAKPLQYALVGHDGTIKVPPTSIPASDGAIGAGFEIASDGDGFVITWADVWDCTCLRSVGITAAGTIAGSQIFHSDNGACLLAWNGQTYLAAWTQWVGGQQYVRARPLGPTGAPTGPMMPVSGPHETANPYILSPEGDGFLLLTGAYRLFHLNADGSPLGPPATFWMSSGFEWGWTKGPGDTLLHTYAWWVSNPYNGSRVQGRLIDVSPGPPGDLDGDGSVGFGDLLILLAAWGDCPPPPADCAADLDSSGEVGFADLLILLANWS